MAETVVIAAGDLREGKAFVEKYLHEDDKPIIVCDGRQRYHLRGVRADRVIRLSGYFRRDDRSWLEEELVTVEKKSGLLR